MFWWSIIIQSQLIKAVFWVMKPEMYKSKKSNEKGKQELTALLSSKVSSRRQTL